MDKTDKSAVEFDRFQVWNEYEKIAMHFNDLIIRLRSQSLGGVAAFATLAGVVARTNATTEFRWGLFAGAFALLSIFWIAVWTLDLGYYNRLLLGAVDALLSIERDSKGSKSVVQIDLSTKIEGRIRSGPETSVNSGSRSTTYQKIFYSLVLLALLAGFAVSVCGYLRN